MMEDVRTSYGSSCSVFLVIFVSYDSLRTELSWVLMLRYSRGFYRWVTYV